MAEEISQEERVKNHQVAIAKSMKVNKDILPILQAVKEWHIREWLYICGLDGMPAEQIQSLVESNASVTKIRKARIDFLQSLWKNTDQIEQQVMKMKNEVTAVCAASKKVRSAIEKGLEDALKKQSEAQEATIQAKDQLIEMLQQKIKQLQEIPKQPEQKPDSNQCKQQDENLQRMETDTEKAVTEKSKGIFTKFLSERDTKNFIDQYIQNPDYSQEQKEYFLKCLEQGYKTKEIAAIASPNLTVAIMERLMLLKKRRNEDV